MTLEFWEGRYQASDMPWEKGEAAPGLLDFLASNSGLPRGTVGVPGCGTGHDARAWAAAGFSASGFDIAPSAIQLAIMKTRETGLAVSFKVADFLRDDPPMLFDWIFEHTLFCAIQPGERAAYVRAVERWLKPGGQFVAIHYMITDGDGPPFDVNREELMQRFSSGFELLREWEPRSYPNRTGRERMFWWRRRSADAV